MTSRRLASIGAAAMLAGAVISGPVAVLATELLYPQPAWRDAQTFAAHYHPMQIAAYLAGLVMLGGFVALISGLAGLARSTQRPAARCAAALVVVYAALVTFNYVVQTTFIPALVAGGADTNASMISALTMTNPRSLGWALEMWGYGFLGVATWLVAPVLGGWARRTFALNGPISLAGTAWTVLQPGWPITTAGLIAFAAWNLLVVAMGVLALLELRRNDPRRTCASPPISPGRRAAATAAPAARPRESRSA